MIKHTFDKKNATLRVVVSVPEEEYLKVYNDKVKEATKNIKVPGYRAGKAPFNKLVAYVNHDEVALRTFNYFKDKKNMDAVTYAENLKIKSRLIDRYVELGEQKGENSIAITYVNVYYPDFDDLDWSKIKVKPGSYTFTAAQFKVEQENYIQKLSKYVPAKKTAKTQSGDKVLIDFKGFIDNEPFEGGEATEYELQLGSKSFIEGFEDQLVGKKAGWKGEVKVKFPENYFSAAYRGKDAVFEVFIHSFQTLEKFQITDEYVKSLQMDNIKNVDEFWAFLKRSLLLNKVYTTNRKLLDDLISKIYEVAHVPQYLQFINREIETLEKEFAQQLKTLGMKKSEYLNFIKVSEAELDKQFKEEATSRVGKSLVFDFLTGEKFAPEYTKEEVQKLQQANKQFPWFTEQVAEDFLKLARNLAKILNNIDPKVADKVAKSLNPLMK
ncbi:trigger factor [Mycoplasma corogypsi]|uniref:trigger factor n=1 Tax=Mycoplasma corogypsi TaxID=2106 RepID=UPI00387350CA